MKVSETISDHDVNITDESILHSDIPDISVQPIAKQYLKEVKTLIPNGKNFIFLMAYRKRKSK